MRPAFRGESWCKIATVGDRRPSAVATYVHDVTSTLLIFVYGKKSNAARNCKKKPLVALRSNGDSFPVARIIGEKMKRVRKKEVKDKVKHFVVENCWLFSLNDTLSCWRTVHMDGLKLELIRFIFQIFRILFTEIYLQSHSLSLSVLKASNEMRYI